MANEVIKHHNDLNTIPMRNWTKEEMNFFFAIIAKIRDQGTKEITFNKYDLAELAQYAVYENKRYADTIEGLVKNVAQIYYIEKTNNSIELMNLFSRFKATWSDDLSEMDLIVKVTDEFDYVVNRLDSEFTSYELAEFTQIRSTYAKTLYRLLKQWRTIGKKEFQIDEFKRLLDTPKYYKPSHINKNILTPARKELPQFFPNLKVKPIKSNKRGTPVIAYEFTWKPERTNKWVPNKYDKRNKKKQTLPDWVNNNGEKDVPLPLEDQEKFKEKIEKFRKLK